MKKVEILVPELATPKTGEYVCECQKKEIKLEGKEAQVFWVAKLNDHVRCGEVLCELEARHCGNPSPCDGV